MPCSGFVGSIPSQLKDRSVETSSRITTLDSRGGA
jgi:hypothetical protein